MSPLTSNPFAAIATHPWAYPALEVIHLLGVALLLGNLVLVELRHWRTGAMPEAVDRLALGVVLTGFMAAAASGLVMFATQPMDLIAKRAFLLKMPLLMLAGINAAAFHARGGLARRDVLARAQTLASLGRWVVILACGRAIAYA